jgi:predicted porin
MNKQLIALAVSAGVALPSFAQATEVTGKALEIYGKAHVSLDSVSGYDTATTKASNLSLSSNSSRIGFKGEAPIGSFTGFYKVEGSVSFGNGDTSTGYDHRAAYAGIKGGMGSILAGYRDTALKDVRGKFDVFGDTVGDARNIIGSVQGSNYFDKRAKNAIMYSTPKTGGFQANLMYSTAWTGDATAQAGQDNNNESLSSVNLLYSADALSLAAAWEQQKFVDGTTGETNDKATATRLVGAYDMGSMRIGLIYENLDDDNSTALRRSAYGANIVFKVGEGKVKLQYIKAGDTDAGSDTGATEVALGYDMKLAKNASAYVAYSKISNDANASYVMGNGHDQKYTTTAGQDVSAVSLGFIYSF